jgi:hypothetical protein
MHYAIAWIYTKIIVKHIHATYTGNTHNYKDIYKNT